MRCKACGRVVPDGSVKCPHCGAYMSKGSRPGEEFKWNIQEYPKPKNWEPADMSIDWQSGQIVDRGSGRTYDQGSGSGWTEPEEVKYMFTFEPDNEELQREVDKQVDILAERAPKEPPAVVERRDLFSLPSQMDMKDYDNLLEDDDPAPSGKSGWINDYLSTNFDGTPIQPVQPSEEPVYKKAPTAAEFIFGTGVKKEEPLLNWDLAGRPEAVQNQAKAAAAASAAARQQAQQAAAAAAAQKEKAVPPPERAANGKYSVPKMMQEQQYDPFETRKTWGSVHVPDFLRNGNRLIFASSGPDIYEEIQQEASRELGPSAGYKADMEEIRAQETFKRLIDVEQKFSEDMDRVVFMSDEEKEQEARVERKREELVDVPQIDFLTIEDEYDRYREENGIPRAESIEEVLGTEAAEPAADASEQVDDSSREVNIRINGPSGTQYTVKTQEIHMNSEDPDSSGEPAKAMQVSVEVNGGGSVEVTSGPDGATKVTATDEGMESLPAAETEPFEEPEEDVPFWEKKPVTRMTITDIFGPEAREILEAVDQESAGQEDAGEQEEMFSTMKVSEKAAAEADSLSEEVPETEAADTETGSEEAVEETEISAEAEEVKEETVEAAEAAEAVEGEPAEQAEPDAEAAVAEEEVPVSEESAAAEEMEADTETAAADTEEEPSAEAADAVDGEPAEQAESDAEAAVAEEEVPVSEESAADEEMEADTETAAADTAEEPAAETADAAEGEPAEQAEPDAAAAEAEEEVPVSEESAAAEEMEPDTETAAADNAEEPAETADFADLEFEDYYEYEEEPQEFTYSLDEERLTKEEIRNMSQEELEAAAAEAAAKEAAKEAEREEEKKKAAAASAAMAAAAEGIKSSDTAAETSSAGRKADDSGKTGEPEQEKKKKLFKKQEPSEKEGKTRADKEAKAQAKAEEKARKKAAKAEAARAARDEDEPMSLKIMRIVIIILIVAVVLEFLIFGIRLLAPDSMLGIIFNKIGSGITGASSLFGSGVFRL